MTVTREGGVTGMETRNGLLTRPNFSRSGSWGWGIWKSKRPSRCNLVFIFCHNYSYVYCSSQLL